VDGRAGVLLMLVARARALRHSVARGAAVGVKIARRLFEGHADVLLQCVANARALRQNARRRAGAGDRDWWKGVLTFC